MGDNRESRIAVYQREILKLLKALRKEQDLRMWQQIYTVIHCFYNMKGVEKHDGRR